jgi:general stress protein 26
MATIKTAPIFDTKARELIATNKNAVLSTVTENGRPQSAVITYLFVSPEEFYIVMGKESAKYKNLLKNNNVALVIYEAGELPGTVQIEGKVSIVKDVDEERYVLDRMVNEVWSELPYYPISYRMKDPKLALIKMKIDAAKWFKDEMKLSTAMLYPQTVSKA